MEPRSRVPLARRMLDGASCAGPGRVERINGDVEAAGVCVQEVWEVARARGADACVIDCGRRHRPVRNAVRWAVCTGCEARRLKEGVP